MSLRMVLAAALLIAPGTGAQVPTDSGPRPGAQSGTGLGIGSTTRSSAPVELTLRRPTFEGALQGAVRDAGGKPWSGAVVWAIPSRWAVPPPRRLEPIRTASDRDGRFRLQLEPGEVYRIWAHGTVRDGRASCTGVEDFAIAGKPVLLQALPAQQVLPVIEIRGSAAWKEHGPLLCELTDDPLDMGLRTQLPVAADGLLDVPPASERWLFVRVVAKQGLRLNETWLAAAQGKPNVIALAPPKRHVIRVWSNDGKPIARAQIYQQSESDLQRVGETDAAGRCVLPTAGERRPATGPIERVVVALGWGIKTTTAGSSPIFSDDAGGGDEYAHLDRTAWAEVTFKGVNPHRLAIEELGEAGGTYRRRLIPDAADVALVPLKKAVERSELRPCVEFELPPEFARALGGTPPRAARRVLIPLVARRNEVDVTHLCPVQLRLLAPDGAPASYATVLLHPQGGSAPDGGPVDGQYSGSILRVADRTGRVQFLLPAQTPFECTVFGPGLLAACIEATRVVGDGAVPELTLRLRAAKVVTGLVQMAGSPLVGARALMLGFEPSDPGAAAGADLVANPDASDAAGKDRGLRLVMLSADQRRRLNRFSDRLTQRSGPGGELRMHLAPGRGKGRLAVYLPRGAGMAVATVEIDLDETAEQRLDKPIDLEWPK